MCTAGGPRFFCPPFGGGSVLSLLRSTELSSGRNSAGVAPGRKNEYANTFLSLRERLNSVTLICVAALGWRGASPESERLFFFAVGSEMLLSNPWRSFLRSLVASSDVISFGSVGSNMQKITELFARLTEAITVSIDTRLFVGSGEKNTRTVVFPILIGRDQPASLAVSPMVGSSAISCCLSTNNFASWGELKM